jgi:hypothetical protein
VAKTVRYAPFRGSPAKVGSKFVGVSKDYLEEDLSGERWQRVIPIQFADARSRLKGSMGVISPHVSNGAATRGSNLDPVQN